MSVAEGVLEEVILKLRPVVGNVGQEYVRSTEVSKALF